VVLGGAGVRWVRVEAFAAGGRRVGWAHGDEHGEVLLIVGDPGGVQLPPPARLDLAIRVHWPDPAQQPPTDPLDPMADLAVEPIARSAAPPLPSDLDNDTLRGIARPPGYLTVATDVVVTVPVGEVVRAADIAIA
jgi:hypothetical protein